MKKHRLAAVAAVLAFASTVCFGQIPRTIAYQGVLTDSLGNPKPDGSYSMTFRLYSSEVGGAALWTEMKTINVKGGLFSTYLGDQVVIGAGITFDRPYWLGIQVATGSELVPRTALSSVGYSLSAVNADSAKYVKIPPVPGGPAGGDLQGTYPNPTIKPITRTLSFGARSLSYDPSTTIITLYYPGLRWQPIYSTGAFLMTGKPSDWDGTSAVTLTIYFYPLTSTAGNVDFFIRPRAFNPGDNIVDASSLNSTPVPNAGSLKLHRQTFTIPASRFGTKELWWISIQNQASGSTYPDDVAVNAVTLSYTAVR